jgi:transposase
MTSWSRSSWKQATVGRSGWVLARFPAPTAMFLRRCYVPEPVDEMWSRLRHLGAGREQLITEAGSQIQQMRDLLECAWPAALDTARQPGSPRPGSG